MELAIIVLCMGLGIGSIIVAAAWAYRVIGETQIKAKILTRESKEEAKKDEVAADLERRLEALGHERFGVPMRIVQRPGKSIKIRPCPTPLVGTGRNKNSL